MLLWKRTGNGFKCAILNFESDASEANRCVADGLLQQTTLRCANAHAQKPVNKTIRVSFFIVG